MKEINLSHQSLILCDSLLRIEGVLHLETWVIFTIIKINLEMYTKLPQTSSIFIPEAIAYDFSYKLMVMACLSCMAYIMHSHNIRVPEGT